jgi:UDP-N-acetylglucosamine 2-epimerase
MRHVDLLIGNTSSGIIEAASFSKPVVNIGNRQSGRLKGDNIIDCEINELSESIKLATSANFKMKYQNKKNIYGAGEASSKIVSELIKTEPSIVKKFKDI